MHFDRAVAGTWNTAALPGYAVGMGMPWAIAGGKTTSQARSFRR